LQDSLVQHDLARQPARRGARPVGRFSIQLGYDASFRAHEIQEDPIAGLHLGLGPPHQGHGDRRRGLEIGQWRLEGSPQKGGHVSEPRAPVLVGLDFFSAKPLENVSLQLATIRWRRSGDAQARFHFKGQFDLPEGFTRDDLSRDLTLCVTIAGETGCDTVTFTQHRKIWHYCGPDGGDDGMDVRCATIVWHPGRAIIVVRGELNLPGVDRDTRPAEATVGLSLPVETPGPTPGLVGEILVSFETHRRLWYYRNW
jgi:hypothetical protein